MSWYLSKAYASPVAVAVTAVAVVSLVAYISGAISCIKISSAANKCLSFQIELGFAVSAKMATDWKPSAEDIAFANKGLNELRAIRDSTLSKWALNCKLETTRLDTCISKIMNEAESQFPGFFSNGRPAGGSRSSSISPPGAK